MIKTLRSIIHENFPFDLRVELDMISRRRDLIKEEKPTEILNLLRKYNIEVTPLGPGTNRYAFKINGYVCKVATDNDGKIDNLKEFKMSKRLYPDVTKTYEVSSNGSLLIAEYISPFQSYAEMMKYADEIRAILSRLSSVYLIGDVGVTSKNYVNWGLRIGYDKPVCLDFAYVYDVSSDLFICRECRNNSMLTPNRDFTELFCPTCGKKYLFEDIRARIGNDVHNHEIGDLTEEGYLMYESNVPTELTPERSNYLQSKSKEDKKKKKDKAPVEAAPDNFVMEYPPEFYLNQYNFQGGSNMEKFTQTEIAARFAESRIVDAVAVSVKSTKASDEPAFTAKLGDDVQYCTADAVIVPATKVEVVNKPEQAKKPAPPLRTEESNPLDSAFDNLKKVESQDDSEKDVVSEQSDIESDDYDEWEGVTVDDDYDENNLDYSADQNVAETKDWAMDESFCHDFQSAVSDISNDIEAYLENIDLYEDLCEEAADSIVSNEIKTEPEFYKALQNAVFRSLCNYFDLECVEVQDKKRVNGIRREWRKVNPYPDESVHASALFLARYYYGADIHENVELKFRDAFKNAWPNCEFGFNHDWIQCFQDRLLSKFDIEPDGMDIISSAIESYWCVNEADCDNFDEYEVDDDEYYLPDDEGDSENDTKSDDAEDGKIDLSQYVGEADHPEQDVNEGGDEKTVEAEAVTVEAEVVKDDNNDTAVFSGNIEQADTDDTVDDDEYYIDDEEDDSIINSITISENDGMFDIVHEITDLGSDSCEERVTYIYDSSYVHNPVSVIDPRNGSWDFLAHSIPNMTFTTMNPDRWISAIYDNRASLKFIILKPETDTTPAIVGVYDEPDIEVLDCQGNGIDIFKYDEDDLEILEGNKYLEIINSAMCSISGTAVDLLPRILKVEPHPEDDMIEMYKEVLKDFAVKNEPEQNESNNDDINEAAIRALMNGIDVKNTSDETGTDKKLTFKPVHRPKK